jgi:hypothetical protein
VVLQSCGRVMEACDHSVRGSLLVDRAGDHVRIYSCVGRYEDSVSGLIRRGLMSGSGFASVVFVYTAVDWAGDRADCGLVD